MIDNTFMLCDLMGVGGSSKVYNAKGNDGEEYALKIIRKDKGYSDGLSRKLVENEHFIATRIGQHPNLVKILSYNSNGTAILTDGTHPINYLVMENCKNGALSNIIRQTGPLEEDIAKFLFMQLCAAVKFIHKNNFAHMDIKLENILLDDFFNIKLADLGTAVDVSEYMGHTNKRRGTPNYMAPEVQNKNSEEMIDASLADVYSLGVCLHLLLTGEFPGNNALEDEVSIETESSDNIANFSKNNSKSRIEFLSAEGRDLLEEILEENAFFRISIDEIMNHPWLNSNEFSDNQIDAYQEMKSRFDYIAERK